MKALRLHADLIGENGESAGLRSPNSSATWKNPRIILENLPAPIPGEKEVLMRVKFCGLCGSDFHLAESGKASMVYPGLTRLPVTIGHEFSGIVEAHGPGISAQKKAQLPLGSPVTAEEMLWCGECGPCLAGNPNHCENLEELGFTVDGAHAEFVKAPSKVIWSLASLAQNFGLDEALRLGALVEPYAVSYRALFQGAHGSRWAPGLKVLVIGSGPIGAAAVDLALLAGAVRADVLETAPGRREFALALGAGMALPPEEAGDLPGEYDWIVDAAGAPDLCEKLVASKAAVGGTLSLLARTAEVGRYQSEHLITKNLRILGSQGHSGESAFPRVIGLMAAGRTQAGKFVKEVIQLEEAQVRLAKQQKCEGKILVAPGNA